MARAFLRSIAAGITVLAFGLALRAQDPDDARRGVAGITVVDGQVSVQRGDSGEWVAATPNAPVLTGDRISTAPNSRAEVQFDSGDILRIGGDAEVTLTQLEYNRYQMVVGRGTVTFRVLRTSGSDIEVDTPVISVRPSKVGAYRITVRDGGDSEITSRAGDVEVFTPRGTQWVYTGQSMLARGTQADPEYQIVRATPVDEWDRWNDSRDRALTASVSNQYVPPGVSGSEELDPYGSWVDVPSYGYVWRPVVAAGWAPYRYGRWVWLDWYGWTWVSADPWGWAPYHYGRWFYEPAFGWCWYPGAIGVRHYWSPALVAFFGFGGGFGSIGWVPLAPYEVLHPWWGRGYYGHADYFNHSVNVVNVNIYNSYRNARASNGYTAVSNNDFRAGRFNNFVRPGSEELRQASFARGPIPVVPERSNLRYSDRQATYVPQRVTANSRVYQYRQATPVERIPFSDQRRGLGSASPVVEAPRNEGAFGRSAQPGQVQPGPLPRGNEQSRWQRFGSPNAQTAAPAFVPRNEPVAPQVAPRSAQPVPSGNRGWGRFGEPSAAPRQEPPAVARPEYRNEPRAAAPVERFNPGSRQEPLRIAPQVVRERPAGGGGGYRAAPRNEQRGPSGGNSRESRGDSGNRGGGGHGRR
jgi:hypothetical protein